MLRARRWWVIGSFAVATAACTSPAGTDAAELKTQEPEPWPWANLGKSCSPESAAYSLPEEERSRLHSSNDLNADWAAITQQVPGGWGGFFVVGGRPTIYLQDLSKKEPAVAALARLMPELARFDLSNVDVRRGRWNFSQMYDWYRFIAPFFWQNFGALSSDIQESRNRLEYGVLNEANRAGVENAFRPLDLPCYLVAIGLTTPAVALDIAYASGSESLPPSPSGAAVRDEK
jgi:hypothetical protein